MSMDLQIKVDASGALPEIKKVESGLSAAEQKAKDASRSVQSVENTAKDAATSVKGIMGALSGLSVSSALGIALHMIEENIEAYRELEDRVTTLTNKAQKFVTEFRSVNEVLDRQVALAVKLHTTTSEVIDVYDAVGDATDHLNLSIGEQTQLTEALGKSALLAGESLGSVSSRLQSMGIAFETGGGTGRQMRSFLRDNHDLAIALENTLHMTSREIIEASQSGKLSYADFVQAVIAGGHDLDAVYGKIKKTHAEWKAEAVEGYERAIAAGDDWKDALQHGVDVANGKIKESQKTFGEWFADLQTGFRKIEDDAEAFAEKQKKSIAGWEAAKYQADSFSDKVSSAIDIAAKAWDKLTAKVERHKRVLVDLHAFRGQVYEAEISHVLDQDRAFQAAAEREMEGIDRLNQRKLAKMEREEEMERSFQLESDKLDAEATKKRLENIKRVEEAWAQGLGHIAGEFLVTAMQGEKSFGDMTEKVLRDLALLALRQAATSMGGPYGSFFGAALGAFGGGATGFDYTIPNSRLALPGFAGGGDATIGGNGGTDSTLVMFRGTPGETLHVRTPQQGPMGGGAGRVVINLQNDRRDLVEGFDSSDGERVFVKLDRKLGRRRR